MRLEYFLKKSPQNPEEIKRLRKDRTQTVKQRASERFSGSWAYPWWLYPKDSALLEQCGDICFNKQNWRSSGMTQSPVECVPLHSESLISSLPVKFLLERGGKCYYVIRLASFYCVFPLSQSTFTAEL